MRDCYAMPWEAGKEIVAAVKEIKEKYDEVIIIANSIGAYFLMHAGIEEMVKKAYFISPIVDMEKLIRGLMAQANVSESVLQEKGSVCTDFGENLSWEYLCYGFKDSNLFVSRLPFSANLLVFSLLGVSQAASKPSKLPRNLLTERCFTVLVCLFFTKARQKDEGMLAHCEDF